MKIKELLARDQITFSCEIFPPKKDLEFSGIHKIVDQIHDLGVDFISVTYGAGGSTSKKTLEVASYIQDTHHTPALAHLTCCGATKEDIARRVQEMKARGIENVLALRGDLPQDYVPGPYTYAIELIRDIKTQGDFCVGAACYPEGHVECAHKEQDIGFLKEKVEAGCDFLTTQMFFDNNILYNFLYRIREKGITVPVVAGIMPVTNGKQIARICKLSGTYLPERFKAIVDRFGDNPAAMRQAGVAYAAEQIIDLIANGVEHIHIYSMNKPEIASSIQTSLSEVLK